jgi:hypothetical protein
MSLQLPSTQNTVSEPKPYNRDASDEDDYESNSFQVQQDRAWLREQLLAGKYSPLCDLSYPRILPKVAGSSERRALK